MASDAFGRGRSLEIADGGASRQGAVRSAQGLVVYSRADIDIGFCLHNGLAEETELNGHRRFIHSFDRDAGKLSFGRDLGVIFA